MNTAPHEQDNLPRPKVDCQCNNDGCGSFIIMVILFIIVANLAKLRELLQDIKANMQPPAAAKP